MYTVIYAEGVADDFRRIPANQRALILERIELQLRYEPTRQTRNRKILAGLVPPWEHVDPFRNCVIIRAILHTPPHKRTEEIL